MIRNIVVYKSRVLHDNLFWSQLVSTISHRQVNKVKYKKKHKTQPMNDNAKIINLYVDSAST